MDGYRASLTGELERRRELTVAHAGPDGRPLSTTVAYCNDGAMIYFVAPADSEAFAGIEPHAQVSLALGDSEPAPMLVGLKHIRITLPARGESSGKVPPLNALIAEVTDPVERARAAGLLAARYPGVGPVMRRARENGFPMRMMRAVPFIGLAPARPANAA
jgi:hypothetical protein